MHRTHGLTLLLATLALLLAALTGLAAPAAPAHPAPSTPSADTAAFLASLATAPASATQAQPATTPVSSHSGCTSDAQCPTGQLCCRACGFFGCTATACFAPMNGHCPLFP